MTPYSSIINRFLRKVKEDKEFFLYHNTTEQESIKLIEERSLGLLEDSIMEIQPQINKKQNVNFYNKNDLNKCFNFKLVSNEEDFISDMMIAKLYDEGLLKHKVMGMYLGKDITKFSPSADRKSYQDLTRYKHSCVSEKIEFYNMIDRETGDFLI